MVFSLGNNRDFQSSDFMGRNAFLNSKTFKKIDLFAKKPSKMTLQISMKSFLKFSSKNVAWGNFSL